MKVHARRLAVARSGARRGVRQRARARRPAPRRASRSFAHARRAFATSSGPQGRDVALTDPRTGEVDSRMRLTFDHVIGALQPFTYAPELAALLPEVIGRATAGDFGPLYAGAMLVTGRSRRAVEHRAPLLGHLRGRRAARVGRRSVATALADAAHETARATRARRVRGLAEGRGRGRRDHAGQERRSGADPFRRPRSGHAARRMAPRSRRRCRRAGTSSPAATATSCPRMRARRDSSRRSSTTRRSRRCRRPASSISRRARGRRVWPDRLGARR